MKYNIIELNRYRHVYAYITKANRYSWLVGFNQFGILQRVMLTATLEVLGAFNLYACPLWSGKPLKMGFTL